MATALRSPFVSTFLAVALLLGCPGKDGKDGAAGGAGAQSLVQLTPEPAGANCASGGTRIQSGVDANASGTLDAAEVTATQYVCNGPAGANGHDSLLATTPELAGSNCANGGIRIQSGVDANDNGTLDAGEVASTQYVCAGANGATGQTALVATSTEAPGANCGAGGIRVQSGIDANGNATLDPTEIALTQFVCNGAAGLTSLISTSVEASGANCTWGGTRVQSGLDADSSGALDAGEVTATQYVCNGAPGLDVLVATAAEPNGANCAAGGTKVESGLDANRNGAFDAGEGTATWYVCNGATGSAGSDGVTTLVTVSASGAGVGGCLAGGALIRSGPDASADGVLDDVEVTSSQYLCNGVNGSTGASGLASLVAMTSIPGPADCAYGGTRIESGLDLDRGGTLGPGEITSTQYVCNGAPGADGADGLTSLLAMTQEPLGSADCPNGGTRIVSGLDANANGTLDPTEEGAPQFACNGTDGSPGADGFTALVTIEPDPTGTCAFGGYQVQSGVDANRSGTLDGGEVALTQYVCNGAPGAPGADGTPGAPATPWLVATAPDATGTCQYGGSRIDAGPDSNGNGALDPGEESSTSFACNGAPGTGFVTVMGFTPEPAGPNCPYGGTKVESGPDLNGNGALDPGEGTSTGYVCAADASHPMIVDVTPAPGTTAWPEATFCVTFSEAMDSSTIDPSSFLLTQWGSQVPATLSFPSSSMACLDPIDPLWLFSDYTLSIGEGGTVIRDASGNQLLSKLSVSYWVVPPPMPNLRVAIDSIADGTSPGTFDVAFTVTNTDSGAAGPFTVGFFVDPPFTPDVGDMPDATFDVAGLPSYTTQSGSITLTAGSFVTILAFVDIFGAVAESNEWDNLGSLPPAVTGPIQVSAATVEEFTPLTITVPVNSAVRHAELYLGLDYGMGANLGTYFGNYGGEGFITATVDVPVGLSAYGTVSAWATVSDDAWSHYVGYVAYSSVSTTNLSRADYTLGGGFADSGIPLTFVTVTPSTRPNLTVTIDSVTVPAPGTLSVAWRVTNTGVGDAAASSLGLFLDPPVLPGVGAVPTATVDVSPIAAGAFLTGTIDVPALPGNAVVAFVDVNGAVDESNEGDNLWVPRPALTGPISVDRTTLEMASWVTVTVPVSPNVRSVDVIVGQDYAYEPGYWFGTLTGNFAGEGYVTGQLYVPSWWPTMYGASLWVGMWDVWGYDWANYSAISWVSGTNLATWDPAIGNWVDSGIPLTFVDVTPSTSPNLVVSIGSIVPGATSGTYDVAYTVSNTGYGPAGPSTLGFFVNPASAPQVGWAPDASLDVGPLDVGSPMSGVFTVTAPTGATIVALADVFGAVGESNEDDNMGALRADFTGPIVATPSPVAEGGQLTVTVPVNQSTRSVQIVLGTDYFWGWSTPVLATLYGNATGEGFITGTVDIPMGMGLAGNSLSVWAFTFDALGTQGFSAVGLPYYAGTTELIRHDPSTASWGFTGLPLTYVDVTPPSMPNLRMRLVDAVPAAGGGLDVTFLVNNVGYSDAGPFTVGIFVDPMVDPGVGSTPQASFAVPGLAMATQSTITINVPGTVYSRLLGFVDVNDEVAEFNETDNLGRMNPYMTGAPVVTPNPVELTGGLTVTVPVNFAARSIDVELGYTWGMPPTWWLGSSGGNWDGEREISATFSIPSDPWMVGTLSVWITVWDDSHSIGRRYVLDPAQSPDLYTIYNALTGTPLSVSTFPVTFVDVVDATHPNLTVTLGAITDGAVAGTVDVPYTVTNATAFDAGSSTLGFFVDPMNDPVMGDLPTDSVEIAPLPAGASASGTFTLTATRVDRIVAFADVLGAVVETNESDNLGVPPPALLGTIEATPSVVDEGTLLTLTIPVSGNTFSTEVWVGHDATVDGLQLGQLDGNWENQGFISGSLVVPPGTAAMGLVSVWVVLYDEGWTRSVGYAAIAGGPNYAEIDMDTVTWTDSGIPLTYVQIVPATRPNLTVTVDQVTDMYDGTFNVDYTLRNLGAGDAGTFDVGFFVDPPEVPTVGDPGAGLVTLGGGIPVGGAYSGTINVTATGIPAIFAFVDVTGAIDEQSETDNLGYKLPAPLMTGAPVPSVATVAEGASLDVTVPVSTIVRRIEVYIGSGGMMGGGPASMIGTAAGNGAGEGTITATCTAPIGSAGDWTIWVATYDLYGIEWRGYGTEESISTVYYSEYNPLAETVGPTTIPLTSLTITP